MSSFLVYWKDYAREIAEYGDSAVNELWHTKRKQFYDQVKPGDDLWVVIRSEPNRAHQWFLRQRIRVAQKRKRPHFERPYQFIGNEYAGEKFDVDKQSNLEPVLKRLDFKSGTKIKGKGTLIGRSLEMYHRLTEADIDLLRQHVGLRPIHEPPPETAPLTEDGYVRESEKQRIRVQRKHNALSNALLNWLQGQGYSLVAREKNQIDFLFRRGNELCLFELKVCGIVGSTQRIREAIGQILEYNYFPNRKYAEKWAIILDQPPSSSDVMYLRKLKGKYKFPLSLGWQTRKTFVFAKGLDL